MYRLLLVDDNVAVLAALDRLLRAAGYNVTTAANGRAALEIIDTQSVHLVIADIHMPEMDGIELLRAIRAKAPSLPVIALSGGGALPAAEALKAATLLGAVTTVEKSATVDGLLAAIGRALNG